MTAPLMAEVVSRWIESGEMDRLNALQRTRIDAEHGIARQSLGGVAYRQAPTSSHLWLPLPEPWRAAEFAAALRQKACS